MLIFGFFTRADCISLGVGPKLLEARIQDSRREDWVISDQAHAWGLLSRSTSSQNAHGAVCCAIMTLDELLGSMIKVTTEQAAPSKRCT